MVGAWCEDSIRMMTMMMDHMLCERDNTSGLQKAIEKNVDMNDLFNVKAFS